MYLKLYFLYPIVVFCFFKHLPNKRLVFVNIANKYSTYLNSCLVDFLEIYLRKVRERLDDPLPYEKSIDKRCQIEERLNKCEHYVNQPVSSKLNHLEITNTLKWLVLIGPVILMPLTAFLAFVTNLIIVLVILNKENLKKYFSGNRMHIFMLFNSVFNMIECFIALFRLMGICLGVNSLYCSTIMVHMSAQYFKIYFVSYLAEVMKTCSILTTIAFSYERYIITSDSQCCLAVKFKKLKLKRYLAFVIAFSFLISYNKTFEYGTYEHLEDASFGNEALEKPKPLLSAYSSLSSFQMALSYVHYVFNNCLALIVNILIDCLLIIAMRKDLKSKARNIMLRNTVLSSDLASKKLADIAKTQTNLNKMIIYLMLVYLVCRFPHFLMFLLFLFHIYDRLDSMDAANLYTMQHNTIEFLYLLSYLSNIYFYMKFNKYFRLAFKSYFGTIENKNRKLNY